MAILVRLFPFPCLKVTPKWVGRAVQCSPSCLCAHCFHLRGWRGGPRAEGGGVPAPDLASGSSL